jgi:SPP1 family predicted phage head-tail adaptor
MLVGKLDRYVRVEEKYTTYDTDFGAETVVWIEYKTAWASIMDITTKSQESTNSDLRQLKQPCRVKMRYDKNINADMRIVMLDRDERILQIISQPAELGRREGIEFMAENYEV